MRLLLRVLLQAGKKALKQKTSAPPWCPSFAWNDQHSPDSWQLAGTVLNLFGSVPGDIIAFGGLPFLQLLPDTHALRASKSFRLWLAFDLRHILIVNRLKFLPGDFVIIALQQGNIQKKTEYNDSTGKWILWLRCVYISSWT